MVGVQCIEQGVVQKNSQVSQDSFAMVILAPRVVTLARPGQFVMVACSETGQSPLLRRPLSIHAVDGDCLTLLYRVVGQGTELLANMQVNHSLSILGPLGTGFAIPEKKHHCLVGGGIGIAPLLFLARAIRRAQPESKITLLAGARSDLELLAIEKFQPGVEVLIATDDGSEGHHGFVTELLAEVTGDVAVYTCGPTPMMKGVAEIAREHGWGCQVSLESHMACGMGACLGCAVERSGVHEGADKYVHVCKDGPVFKAEEIWA